ncbi:MAG: hypothetical protein QM569_11455, partial [Acidovorax sp.]
MYVAPGAQAQILRGLHLGCPGVDIAARLDRRAALGVDAGADFLAGAEVQVVLPVPGDALVAGGLHGGEGEVTPRLDPGGGAFGCVGDVRALQGEVLACAQDHGAVGAQGRHPVDDGGGGAVG